MKNVFYIILAWLFLCFPATSVAQDETNKNLHFIYIAHEVNTPVQQLCQRIRTLQEDYSEVGDALIVYLSNSNLSLTSFTNIEDPTSLQRNQESKFTEIIAALNDANAYDVDAEEDLRQLINLFDEINFLDSNGNVKYASVTFDFYVGSNFWNLGYNEKVIGHIYHSLGLYSLPKAKFLLNVYVPRSNTLKYPDNMPFGDNNIDGINQKIKVLRY